MSDFINPYNFVSVDGSNFKETEFVDFEEFHAGKYSGRITCIIKSVEDIPIFIPDSKSQEYAIFPEGDDNEIYSVISRFGINPGNENFYKLNAKGEIEDAREEEPQIDLDFSDPNKLLQSITKKSGYVHGKLDKIKVNAKGEGKFCIITNNPKSYTDRAHKIMGFCKDPDSNPIIPSTSIKGMIHNTVEILSNSCMAFFEAREDNKILYRLEPNIANQNEIGDVRDGACVVVERGDGDAKILELDSAKINTDKEFIIENELGNGNVHAVAVFESSTGDCKYIKRIGRRENMEKCCTGYNKYLQSFELTDGSINNLKKDGLSDDILTTLKQIKGKRFFKHKQEKFEKKLAKLVGDDYKKYKVKILQHTEYLGGRGKLEICKAEPVSSSNYKIKGTPDDFHIEVEIAINGVTKSYKSYYEPRLLDCNVTELYALVYEKTIMGSFKQYHVKAVNTHLSELQNIKNSNHKYANCEIVQAWVKRSGDIKTKTQDMLFFKYAEDDLLKYIHDNSDKAIQIDKRVVGKYENILKDRKENLKFESKNEPDRLNKDDLVYYYNNGGQEYLSYTQIPRKEYNCSIGDLVENKACVDLDELCPACNMFGSTKTKKNDKKAPISGKISIGTGRLKNNYTLNSVGINEHGKPLKILSSPNPSCCNFYLLGGDYNNPASKIRGRKAYYHHNSKKLRYEMDAGDYKNDEIRNNQNSSVEVIRDFEFGFGIDFTNLSEYELGLLLFALDLRNKDGRKMYHKIGMGKPLGLGTVDIQIDTNKSFLINRQSRYNGLFEDGVEKLDNTKVEDFIDCYKTEQSRVFNNERIEDQRKDDFYDIPYVKDLSDILEVNTLDKNYPEVKYPRITKDNEPRGFEWFMKYKGKKLPLPPDIIDNNKKLTGWS